MASDLAAKAQAETKEQPPIRFGIGGLPRADLTLPRSPGQSFNVGNIGHGGNRRCQATAGTARQTATAGQGNVGNGNGESAGKLRRDQQRRIDVANGSRNRELATAGTATPIATGNPQRRIEKVIACGQRKRTARKSWRHRGLDVRMRRKFGRRCVVRQSGGVRRGTEKRVECAVSRFTKT